ncbi:MAG: SufB/SufD family protein [Clostridia bacterium]
METLKLNNTPVRTSRNFGINNIELKDIELPENLKEFKNIEIINEGCSIEKSISNKKLVYGNGEILEENVLKNANSKLKIISSSKNANIKIKYNFDDGNLELIDNIEILTNSNINIVIEYSSKTKEKCFHNGIIRVITHENAKVDVTIINLLNGESNNFYSIENEINNKAEVNYTIIDIGAKNSISNYYSNVLGSSSKNNLKTIYLGTKNEVKDINYIAEIRGENSNVDIDVQGALKDESKKHFKGTIDFKKGCKKSKGNENEFCILLSDKAKSLALPMLLCTEDDIEGNHSTASGKVDNKDLFYIMSRGLSYKEAIRLIVKAKFNQIIQTIKEEELKEEVLSEIDRRID